MEKIIAMIDETQAFAQMFCNYVNGHHILPYQARIFTDWIELAKCTKDYEVQLILASETMESEQSEMWRDRIIWLSERGSDPERSIVNRYQGAERLSKEIVSRLGGFVETTTSNQLAKLTVFYAPSGGSGQTSASLAYCWAKGRQKRVLYVNLEANAGLPILQAEGDRNLSDALYYFLEDSESCRAKLVSCTSHRMELHYIPPTNCARDLEELEPTSLLHFFECLRDPALYDEVVLDLGDSIREPLHILSGADLVVVPILKNQAVQQNKWLEFQNYLEKSIYTDILNHLKCLELPFMEDLFGRAIGWDGVTKSEWTTCFREAGI